MKTDSKQRRSQKSLADPRAQAGTGGQAVVSPPAISPRRIALRAGSQYKNNSLMIKRRPTRKITVGTVEIGGSAPISVQAMTKTPTGNVKATVNQILGLEQIGCDIIRVAVPDLAAARALPAIRRAIHIPLIADIHFDYRLALAAVAGGADGLRINPGNIGSKTKIKEIVRAASERNLPIRIGVNSGSLEKDILARHGAPTAAALVASALRHVRLLEDLGHHAIKISVKASDVMRTVEAYRRLSKATDHPLHLGVTEAGTLLCGVIRSSVALGILLAEGIGDTIRVSLADEPANEVRAGREILRSIGLHAGGPQVIVCPTCARAQMNVIKLARGVEEELEKLEIKENQLQKSLRNPPRPTATPPVEGTLRGSVKHPAALVLHSLGDAGSRGASLRNPVKPRMPFLPVAASSAEVALATKAESHRASWRRRVTRDYAQASPETPPRRVPLLGGVRDLSLRSGFAKGEAGGGSEGGRRRLLQVAQEIEYPQIKKWEKWPSVAVMGCVVNGPGEARDADIALVCGKNKVFLYIAGVRTAALDAESAPAVVAEEVIAFCSRHSD